MADAVTVLGPEPAEAVAVCDPYAVVAPYWKRYVVALPFGFTVPLTWADVAVTEAVDPVVTLGGVPVAPDRVGAAASAAASTTSDAATAAIVLIGFLLRSSMQRRCGCKPRAAPTLRCGRSCTARGSVRWGQRCARS